MRMSIGSSNLSSQAVCASIPDALLYSLTISVRKVVVFFAFARPILKNLNYRAIKLENKEERVWTKIRD